MDKKKLGAMLKRLRNRQNLTQAALAEIANLSVNYVGDLENGRKNVSLEVFCTVVAALGSRADLFLQDYYDNKESTMAVDFSAIRAAYHRWKELNIIIANDMESRKVNLPEAISENIVCYAMKFTRNMDKTGDATDQDGKLIEIKATSNFNSDLSSFSPETHFDRLFFVRLKIEEDKAYIYDLGVNGQQFGRFKVNHSETVADHQAQGRRPRLSLISYIEEKGLEPVKIVDLS